MKAQHFQYFHIILCNYEFKSSIGSCHIYVPTKRQLSKIFDQSPYDEFLCDFINYEISRKSSLLKLVGNKHLQNRSNTNYTEYYVDILEWKQ